MMDAMREIEQKTGIFAAAHGDLCEEVGALNAELEAAKRRHLKAIKGIVARVAEHRAALKALIEARPDLFEKPRTVVFHGVKVGFQKGRGQLIFEDGDAVIARIEKLLPDDADVLIVTERKPNKIGLAGLPTSELRKLGVELVGTDDEVVIRPTDGDVEKVVAALMKGIEGEAA